LLPDGVGALVWDSDVYLGLSSEYDPPIAEARCHFVPFAECPPIAKALLVDLVETLFEVVLELVRMCPLWLKPLADWI
jgi:hypothetical protein